MVGVNGFDLESCLEEICIDFQRAIEEKDLSVINSKKLRKAERQIERLSRKRQRPMRSTLFHGGSLSYWVCPYVYRSNQFDLIDDQYELLEQIESMIVSNRKSFAACSSGGKFDDQVWEKLLQLRWQTDLMYEKAGKNKNWSSIGFFVRSLVRLSSNAKPSKGKWFETLGYTSLVIALLFILMGGFEAKRLTPEIYIYILGIALAFQFCGILGLKKSVIVNLEYIYDQGLIELCSFYGKVLDIFGLLSKAAVFFSLSALSLVADRWVIHELGVVLLYFVTYAALSSCFREGLSIPHKILQYWADRQTEEARQLKAYATRLGPRTRR